ncbi:MAG: hypothetical protein CMO74_15160 [Verrucomicrobiales bacterium]|nr:hypothetical protein [Verrucomicrobiales bacterium]
MGRGARKVGIYGEKSIQKDGLNFWWSVDNSFRCAILGPLITIRQFFDLGAIGFRQPGFPLRLVF